MLWSIATGGNVVESLMRDAEMKSEFEILVELANTIVAGDRVIVGSSVDFKNDVVDVAGINGFVGDTDGAVVEGIVCVIEGTGVDDTGSIVGTVVNSIVCNPLHDASKFVDIAIGVSFNIL